MILVLVLVVSVVLRSFALFSRQFLLFLLDINQLSLPTIDFVGLGDDFWVDVFFQLLFRSTVDKMLYFLNGKLFWLRDWLRWFRDYFNNWFWLWFSLDLFDFLFALLSRIGCFLLNKVVM